MERKRYLTELVEKLEKTTDKEVLMHLGHFAYDVKNHKVLLGLKIINVLQGLLVSSDEKVLEFALGALCNLASNPESHREIEGSLILPHWNHANIHGQRSIACIMFYTNSANPGLISPDKVTNNILSLI